MSVRMMSTGWKKMSQMHVMLLVYVSIAACIGFAMMFSAAGGNVSPWALRQMVHFLLASVLMVTLAIMPAGALLRYAYVIYGVCLMMLVAVEIMGFMGMGAKRWVEVGGVNLQPSEIMKLAVILALARYYHSINQNDVSKLTFLIPPIILVLVPAALILRQPNLGTATILTAVGAILCYMAGLRARYFAIVFVLLLAAAPVGWHFLHDYQKQRVMTFLHPEDDPQGAGYNIMQSIIAIGSGGVFGKGYLQGSQGQLDFLPEKHTDFIFTMLAEEFGFIGCALVLILYLVIISYGVGIYVRCRHVFGGLLAIGVSAMLFVHIVINTAMVMGLIPVVGVPLPLLSYGGSIMISMMMGFGLMQNAYVHRDLKIPRSAGLV
jgi:rod shape determining protein RodA